MNAQAKLRWRCRRGRRELDLLLERYLNNHFENADSAERAAFEALLNRSGPELDDRLSGRMPPGSSVEARVIERILRND